MLRTQERTRMEEALSVFYGIDDAIAAESMRAVDDVLSEYFRKHGLEIGTYGAKWAVRRTDGLEVNGSPFEFTAYSYADCVKWLLAKVGTE